jgi:hypothetical protein
MLVRATLASAVRVQADGGKRMSRSSALKKVKVPTSAIHFAMLSGVSAATWTICLKLGSTKINAALGAMFTLRAHGHEIVLTQEAFWLLVVAGIAAAGVDIFALLAYERG